MLPMLAFLFDGVGFGEWMVLLAVLLVVAGPRRLPEIARTLGKYYSKMQRMSANFRRQLDEIEREVEREAQSQKKELEDAFTFEGSEADAVPDPSRGEMPPPESLPSPAVQDPPQGEIPQ